MLTSRVQNCHTQWILAKEFSFYQRKPCRILSSCTAQKNESFNNVNNKWNMPKLRKERMKASKWYLLWVRLPVMLSWYDCEVDRPLFDRIPRFVQGWGRHWKIFLIRNPTFTTRVRGYVHWPWINVVPMHSCHQKTEQKAALVSVWGKQYILSRIWENQFQSDIMREHLSWLPIAVM